MVCGSCGPKTLTVEDMKHMSSEQIIAAYRQGYKLVQGGGAPQQQAMSQDWQYGGAGGTVYNRSMQNLNTPGIGPGVTCPTGKGSGSTVTLAAAPTGGVGPYTIAFWYSTDGTAATYNGATGKGMAQVGTTHTNVAEGAPGVSDFFVISDLDVAAATGNAATAPTDVDLTTKRPILGGASAALAAGAMRLFSCAIDSCSGAGAPGTCVQYCDMALVCAAPTCNFVVS